MEKERIYDRGNLYVFSNNWNYNQEENSIEINVDNEEKLVKESDYNEIIDYALNLGIINAFCQIGETVSESMKTYREAAA